MTKPAIKVENLWKEYVVGAAQQAHGTFYDMLSHTLKAPFNRFRNLGGNDDQENQFWALQDVNFEVQPGEVLGIIGRNGAGKSTLLKILSRITAPTRGRITVQGRMASLLEVGTGFHPELSGRENIFLNGALLGMEQREIVRKFDEIVEFAEIEKFIDTPVKRYSSGMYVRLAFSVAAHLDPDILVIDEVLAVGDAEFQKKCLGKLEDSRNNGKTVLVVSHHMPTVAKLCRTALWLDKGAVVQYGRTHDVVANYMSLKRNSTSTWKPDHSSNGRFQYEEVAVVAPQGSSPDSIPASQPFRIEFRYQVKSQIPRGRIAFQIRDGQGAAILSSANTDLTGIIHRRIDAGSYVEVCEIPGHLLAPGFYAITISAPHDDTDLIIENVCSFIIESTDSLVGLDGRAGIIAPMLNWYFE